MLLVWRQRSRRAVPWPKFRCSTRGIAGKHRERGAVTPRAASPAMSSSPYLGAAAASGRRGRSKLIIAAMMEWPKLGK